LKSSAIIAFGKVSSSKVLAGLNTPPPSPKRIVTSLEFSLATAKSSRPSELKSPAAKVPGVSPTGITGFGKSVFAKVSGAARTVTTAHAVNVTRDKGSLMSRIACSKYQARDEG